MLGKTMKHRTNAALYSYWNSVRAERIAPQRFEIDPSRISAILPYTFILEQVDAQTLRFRLAGTRMCEIFGNELRGTNFLDGWTLKDRFALLRQISVLTGQGAVVSLSVQLATPFGEKVECEVLLLPLLHTGRTINRVLGSMAPLSTPVWLADAPIASKSLIKSELLWPTRNASTTEAPAADAREPDVMRERPARIVRSRRRQFRVVEGGLSLTDGLTDRVES
jgi:hypothetical protein